MTEPITTDGAEPSSAGEPSSGQQAIAQRAWSRQRQVRTVAIASAPYCNALPRGETPAPGHRNLRPDDRATTQNLHDRDRRHARLRQRGTDRRQDCGQRRSDDAALLALLGPRRALDRGLGRPRQAGRAARDRGCDRIRASARTISRPRQRRSSSRASTSSASTRSMRPRAEACRTGSKRRLI
jgi:hypothetical protein